MTRPGSGVTIAALLLLGACGGDKVAASAGPDVAAVESFLGEQLPAHARDIRTHSERGIDSLVLLRFTAPAAEADIFAERLLGVPPKVGANPQLATFGTGLNWWARTPPAGSKGGSVTRPQTNRTVRVLVAPTKDGQATVWLAAFSS